MIHFLSKGRKRSRNEFDLDDVDDLDGVHMQAKRMKMEPQITLDSEGFNFGEDLCGTSV